MFTPVQFPVKVLLAVKMLMPSLLLLADLRLLLWLAALMNDLRTRT